MLNGVQAKFVGQTGRRDGTGPKYKGTELVKTLIFLHYAMYQSLMRHTVYTRRN